MAHKYLELSMTVLQFFTALSILSIINLSAYRHLPWQIRHHWRHLHYTSTRNISCQMEGEHVYEFSHYIMKGKTTLFSKDHVPLMLSLSWNLFNLYFSNHNRNFSFYKASPFYFIKDGKLSITMANAVWKTPELISFNVLHSHSNHSAAQKTCQASIKNLKLALTSSCWCLGNDWHSTMHH